MINPLDMFAVYNRGAGTRYFLALESGYPGKRIKALPIELGPEEPVPMQGVLCAETDWEQARIPPHAVLVKPQTVEIKTEFETKPLGRLRADVRERFGMAFA